MAPGFTESRESFKAAAEWFLSTVAQVGSRWKDPALGEWDVRALVGHTSRSFLTVETYLGRPAAAIELPTTVDYFRATRAMAAGPEVAARGRDAGAALGEDPVASLHTIADRVLLLISE